MADSGCIGLITGQIIGRWGNFFNCEAFGGYTDSLLAMRLKMSLVNPSMISQELLDHRIVENGVEYIQVHPTFLYESLWNLGVLIFLLWYRKRKKFDGEILWDTDLAARGLKGSEQISFCFSAQESRYPRLCPWF